MVMGKEKKKSQVMPIKFGIGMVMVLGMTEKKITGHAH